MNKIFKNAIFNIFQVIIITPIFFILIPYTLSKIGTEGYGIFALVGVISSYQAFVEMGLTTTLIRYVAKAIVNSDYRSIEEYLATILVIFISLSLFVFVVVFMLKRIIVIHIFGVRENIDFFIFLMILSLITGIVNLISGLFKSIIDGAQRMDISNIIGVAQIISSSIGTVVFLELNMGIKGLVINGLINGLITLITNIFISKSLIKYKINFLSFQISRFKEMFRFSFYLQLSNLMNYFIEPVNKLVIANMFSLTFVGFYDIALKFNSRITNLVRSSLTPLFPATSEIVERNGFEGVDNLRIKSMKIVYPTLIILFITTFVFVYPFVNLWLGNYLAINVTPAIFIFLIGSFFTLLATVPYTLLIGAGFSNKTFRIQIQDGIVNICCVVIFAFLFGFYGFCFGYMLSMVYSFFASNYYYKKTFIQGKGYYNEFFVKKIVVSIIIMVFLGLTFNALFMYLEISWVLFILFLLLFIMLYLIVVWKLKLFKDVNFKNLLGETKYKKIEFLLKLK